MFVSFACHDAFFFFFCVFFLFFRRRRSIYCVLASAQTASSCGFYRSLIHLDVVAPVRTRRGGLADDGIPVPSPLRLRCMHQVTAELLCEMNPDVKGGYVQEDPDSQMNKGEMGRVGARLLLLPSVHAGATAACVS